MKRKKVLFSATTAKGHINVFHLPYMQYFQNADWEVHVVTNGDENCPCAEKQFQIPITRSPFALSNVKALFELEKIMKEENYDLVTCHTPMGGVLTRIAAHRTATEPVIYTAHGFHFYKGAPLLNKLVYKTMERFLAHWTDALVTINEEDFEAASQFRLKKGGQVYQIPGIGVNMERIYFCKEKGAEKRKELGISENTFVVLTIGELIARKNYDTALKAFAGMQSKDVFYVICGRGVLEQELKQQAQNLGIGERVLFAGFRKDIGEFLNMADVFFFPSHQEGLPVAVMEAMAAQLPVVCSRVRGNRDLIEEGKGGYLISPTDIEGFAKALDKIYEKKEETAMGLYNCKKIENYSLENALNAMKELYKKVLGEEV